MSTQIYINPNTCKPEFTKIAAHSFSFDKIADGSYAQDLLIGAYAGESPVGVWSETYFNYSSEQLPPRLTLYGQTMGIPSPINLVADDVVTISGTAASIGTSDYINAGYDVYLTLGVFYFDCTTDITVDKPINTYTFIPVENFQFDANGLVCFETSVTLGSNYDMHTTRFLVGFSVSAICPTNTCLSPSITPTTTVSYTLDIQRPCPAGITNFIIRNCCEPIITELVNIPGLQVGSFHVDDEGNCWEVMSASQDVTNFTRNFVDLYTSCQDCIDNNPCPKNLQIKSCCVDGVELVSGSLPGLNVGDTFVDNNGLCWFVEAETGAPISEESITVGTIISGACEDCILANPCPDFWAVGSCCGNLNEIIATTVVLDIGDSFVDTNGICWSVQEQSGRLPTNYDIVVDTVYSLTPVPFENNCEQCIFYNPCPTEYFLTIRACCDNDRVEVVSVPSDFMSFSEGSVFRDPYGVCWEVMSYSTTGVETYPIDWVFGNVSFYIDCQQCTGSEGRKPICAYLYQVRDCNTDIIYTARVINTSLTVGSYYIGQLVEEQFTVESCFEILGYGYPTVDSLQVSIGTLATEFATCEECNASQEPRWVQLQRCCADDVITAQITGIFPVGQTQYIYLTNLINPTFSGSYCCTLLGPGTPQPLLWTGAAEGDIYADCLDCTNNNGGCA